MSAGPAAQFAHGLVPADVWATKRTDSSGRCAPRIVATTLRAWPLNVRADTRAWTRTGPWLARRASRSATSNPTEKAHGLSQRGGNRSNWTASGSARRVRQGTVWEWR